MVQIGYVMKNLTNALEAESILGLFRYCPDTELPIQPKKKNSRSKFWLTDEQYITLGNAPKY